jgi:protein TonB
MFDLISGSAEHIPSRPTGPVLLSMTAQVVVVGTALAVSTLWVGDALPEIPTMMAFVAAPPQPAPPPPPPATALKRAQPSSRLVPTAADLAAPIEPPERVEPGIGEGEGFDEGVPGGVEGGVAGGVIGGVLGGIPDVPPPPPPPPPAAPKDPVRVGGQISQPTLLHRVEPIYPSAAVAARVQGIAILETIVDEDGRVTDVRVLRSANPLLDREAITAVRQWRYAPVVLNGVPVKFILTVTLSFRLEEGRG